MRNFLSAQHLKRLIRDTEGQALVLIAVAMMVLMLIAGLGLDVGYLRYQKQQMQKAADAGALAGAVARTYAMAGSSDIINAAKSDTKANGFEDTQNGITVTVNNPPLTASVPFVGNDLYVEVIVQQTRPTFFMNVGGFHSAVVRARSIGTIAKSGTGCIYVLDPTSSGSFTASGGQTNVFANCGIFIESNSSSALVASGGSTVDSNTAIDIVGGESVSGGSQVNQSPYPPVQTHSAKFNDPFITLPAPSEQSCPHTPNYLTHGCTYLPSTGLKCSSSPNGDHIKADTYCGGINISSSAGGETFEPGVYILRGGGLTASGGVALNNTTTGGDGSGGVMFYNTTGSVAYAPITVSGGSTTALNAPTSGTYEGILFFQDRSLLPAPSGGQNTVSGGSGTSFQGALYFPTSPLTYSGGSIGANDFYTIIVAWDLTFSGGSYLNDNYASNNDGSPVHVAALAE